MSGNLQHFENEFQTVDICKTNIAKDDVGRFLGFSCILEIETGPGPDLVNILKVVKKINNNTGICQEA